VRAGSDVRLAVEVPPSGRERAMRLRGTLWTAGKLVMGLALVLFLSVHAQDVWSSAVRANPAYAVEEFQFQTNGAISAEVAARVAGLHRNMHVLDIDLEDVRRRLESLPKVRKVRVERRLPGRLVVELEERLPVAWLTGCAAGYNIEQQVAVDAGGMVIPCDEMHRSYVNLPEIEAHEGVVAVIGQTVKSMEMLRAIELLDLMKGRQWHEPRAVRKIEVPGTWSVTAVVRPEGRYIFPVEGNSLSLCLDRLQAVLHATGRDGREVATVDLQPARNVPVSFVADEEDAVALQFSDESQEAGAIGSETALESSAPEKVQAAVASAGVRSLAVTARPSQSAGAVALKAAAAKPQAVRAARTARATTVVRSSAAKVPTVRASASVAAKSTTVRTPAAKAVSARVSSVKPPAGKSTTVRTPAAKAAPARVSSVKPPAAKSITVRTPAATAAPAKTLSVKPPASKSSASASKSSASASKSSASASKSSASASGAAGKTARSVRAPVKSAGKPVVRKMEAERRGVPASVRGAAVKPASTRT
jgi:hypothetical protein